MTRALTLLTLAALVGAPVAEARPSRVQAKPVPNAAIKARQGVLKDFDARMSRLDALMGVPTKAASRSRSAEAGR